MCCLAHYHSLLALRQAEAEEMWLLDSEDVGVFGREAELVQSDQKCKLKRGCHFNSNGIYNLFLDAFLDT